jgi:hypothetical protein
MNRAKWLNSRRLTEPPRSGPETVQIETIAEKVRIRGIVGMIVRIIRTTTAGTNRLKMFATTITAVIEKSVEIGNATIGAIIHPRTPVYCGL